MKQTFLYAVCGVILITAFSGCAGINALLKSGQPDLIYSKALEYYQKAADKGYKSAQEAIARLNGRPAGPYAYAAPEPPKAAAPQEKGPDKKKKGGLFGFFKK